MHREDSITKHSTRTERRKLRSLGVLVDDEPVDPAGKTIEQRVTDLEQDVSGISTAIERGLTT